MDDDLLRFLRARLNEDAAVAQAATAGPWTVNNADHAEAINSAAGVAVVDGGRWGGEASVFESTEDALHIARHDPARVLADVESKRALLNEYAEVAANDIADEPYEYAVGWANGLGVAVRHLAAAYADHPGYQKSWRP